MWTVKVSRIMHFGVGKILTSEKKKGIQMTSWTLCTQTKKLSFFMPGENWKKQRPKSKTKRRLWDADRKIRWLFKRSSLRVLYSKKSRREFWSANAKKWCQRVSAWQTIYWWLAPTKGICSPIVGATNNTTMFLDTKTKNSQATPSLALTVTQLAPDLWLLASKEDKSCFWTCPRTPSKAK